MANAKSKTATPTAPAVEPAAPTVPKKTATVIAMLQRQEGAALGDLVAATGWLPHTTRAALTGLRKKGHVIDKAKIDGTTTYRIARVLSVFCEPRSPRCSPVFEFASLGGELTPLGERR